MQQIESNYRYFVQNHQIVHQPQYPIRLNFQGRQILIIATVLLLFSPLKTAEHIVMKMRKFCASRRTYISRLEYRVSSAHNVCFSHALPSLCVSLRMFLYVTRQLTIVSFLLSIKITHDQSSNIAGPGSVNSLRNVSSISLFRSSIIVRLVRHESISESYLYR